MINIQTLLISELLDEKQLRLFACDCAEHVLHFFEKKQLNDRRPREAIEVARRFALGKATQEERKTARATARAAGRAAAWANAAESRRRPCAS